MLVGSSPLPFSLLELASAYLYFFTHSHCTRKAGSIIWQLLNLYFTTHASMIHKEKIHES